MVRKAARVNQGDLTVGQRVFKLAFEGAEEPSDRQESERP